MKTLLTLIGTRPEAIKMTPILKILAKNKYFKSKLCVTNQQKNLLDSVLLKENIFVDYFLKTDEKKYSLHQKGSLILKQLETILEKCRPDLVLVQGDTTTAFMGALAAFYSRIPIAHIEAGLRTNDRNTPWPEEAHRCIIDQLATYFFAPTLQAQESLLKEGISSEKIWMVGNTAMDAKRLTIANSEKFATPLEQINAKKPEESVNYGSTFIGTSYNSSTIYSSVKFHSKECFILATVHRRENHGQPLQEICEAMKILTNLFSNVRIIFMLHSNPAIRQVATKELSGLKNILLFEPLDHVAFLKLLNECLFVITDSGGIQEEAPSMGKPVLIVRETTERPEGIQAGTARLIGTQKMHIVNACAELLNNPSILQSMSRVHHPYGDGYAANRIVNILERELKMTAS